MDSFLIQTVFYLGAAVISVPVRKACSPSAAISSASAALRRASR